MLFANFTALRYQTDLRYYKYHLKDSIEFKHFGLGSTTVITFIVDDRRAIQNNDSSHFLKTVHFI